MGDNVDVYVFQTDNRGMSPHYPFEFIPMSICGNQKVCDFMGWKYVFREMKPEFYQDNHPAVGKIYMLNEWFQEQSEPERPTFLVFLDTDAWIRDASRLRQLITEMSDPHGKYYGKRGAFSRDPYIAKNTFINSGSFLLRVDTNTRKMYQELLDKISVEPRYLREWPWDQVYVSQYVWEHRTEFLIFKPDVLNTGYGKILRHNWHKTSRKIRDDLYFLCHHPMVMDENAKGIVDTELDSEKYPNTAETGYDYMDFD